MKFLSYLLILTIIITSCKEEIKNDIVSYKIDDITLSSGTLRGIDSFPSQYITPRNVVFWLPENYSKEKKYAVLYMHDGQMLFDANKTWNNQEWMVDEIASKLMNEGITKDFIVVAPWNISEQRWQDYFPEKVFNYLSEKEKDSIIEAGRKNNFEITFNADNYLKFITQELKPFVDNEFSTLSDQQNTFVSGSSMGGLISMYAICEYPEVFGGAACLSTHWPGIAPSENNPIPEAFFSYMNKYLPDSKTHKLYFDYGTETLDAMYLPYQTRVNAVLKKHGFETNLRFEGHDHSEISWQKRLDIPLTFLLGKNDDE